MRQSAMSTGLADDRDSSAVWGDAAVLLSGVCAGKCRWLSLDSISRRHVLNVVRLIVRRDLTNNFVHTPAVSVTGDRGTSRVRGFNRSRAINAARCLGRDRRNAFVHRRVEINHVRRASSMASVRAEPQGDLSWRRARPAPIAARFFYQMHDVSAVDRESFALCLAAMPK